MGGGFCTEGARSLESNCVDVYRSDTNKWDTIETPHTLFSLVVLKKKLLIVGGKDRSNSFPKKVLALENGEWKDFTEMSYPRAIVGVVSHCSMMIVFGGFFNESRAVVELFDGNTGEWFRCDDLPQPMQYPQAVVMGGTMYVPDRGGCKIYTASLHSLFDHELHWDCIQVDLPGKCTSAVVLNNKYFLTLGGEEDNENDQNKNIFTLNSIGTEWILCAVLPEALSYIATVYDDNLGLVVIGGTPENQSFDGCPKVWFGSFRM